ncbi:MAG TPA: NifU family protein [Candidatus Acidoferrales bacterium]|nr:NifU family protein [Candidatus Acidoferrales bacterium]
MIRAEQADASTSAPEETVETRVNRALDKVRPAIQADGGEVWLIRVDGGTAYVQMLGACGGCPASTMTLKDAIEAVVTTDVPEISSVLQI